MRRTLASSLAVVGLLASPTLAHASDTSLRHALSTYESRLTSDIGRLANFAVPSRAAAASTVAAMTKVNADLEGAVRAATAQKASTSAGRRGRTLVLSGLHEAIVAAGDAKAAALAARTGHGAAARAQAAKERAAINRAIPLFESGGKLLHLF